MNAVIQGLWVIGMALGAALCLVLAIGLPLLIIQNTISLSKLRRRVAALEQELKLQSLEPRAIARPAPANESLPHRRPHPNQSRKPNPPKSVGISLKHNSWRTGRGYSASLPLWQGLPLSRSVPFR